MIKTLFTTSLLFLSFSSYALVDYSDASSSPPPKKRKRAPKKISAKSAPSSGSARSSGSGFSFGKFYVTSKYGATTVKDANQEGKVNLGNIRMHMQTQHNFYVDADLWFASSDDDRYATTGNTQKGNPKVKLGFNWLKLGSGEDMSVVNFVAGMSFSSDSDFAASRSDKFFGLETSKRFYDFVLGLGYEMRLTGSPEKSTELDIGNMQSFTAMLGWRATPDIRFTVEGSSHKVRSGSESAAYALREDVSFGQITPRVHLGVSPKVELEMGATYRTKKVQDVSEFVDAKLWDVQGAYGNSIFAGLNISV